MDFSNRNPQPQNVVNTHTAAQTSQNTNSSKGKKSGRRFVSLTVGALLGYLIAVVILVAAVLIVLGLSGPKPQNSYVDSNRLQAVFLNSGQVYFGNIKVINDKYFILENIFYLQTSSSSTSSTSSSTTPTSVSLVKLGCELHAPYDQMIINASQVTFWENLQPTGQVAKAVATFEQENPNGQKCADQSSTSSTTSSGVQGSTTSTTGSTTTKP
jgi:hypothetical protein